MKQCKRCNEIKTLDEFYKHKGMADGHLNICKACKLDDAHQYRKENIERVREYDRERSRTTERIEYQKQYHQSDKGKESHKRATEKYQETSPKKRAAHVMVGNAFRSGLLKKRPCEVCGAENVHAHHDDYDKPMEVRFLCSRHHREWHRVHGEALNPD